MKNQRVNPLKNTKGVSHIFSNVLILLVIIIASSLAFTYVATYVGEYQTGRGAVLLQRLLFEDVWFKNNQIIITVYNYGKVSCNVTSVFINSLQYQIESPAEGHVTIAVEDRETIVVDFVWVSGSAYNLKLLTERGYTVERDYEAP
jgi:hypothetical protein